MECLQDGWPNNVEFLKAFNARVRRERVPLSGSINLTHQCNLKCAHCYIATDCAKESKQPKELGVGKWKSIIDEIADAGCLYLLITGGEPLLRKDFIEIYTHAKNQGFIITVFTNGTQVAEKHLALFRELPPRNVDISLYGATQQTYENITRVKGPYGRCIQGIEYSTIIFLSV